MSSATKKPAAKVKPAIEVTPEATPVASPAKEADERRFCSSCSRTKPVLGGVMARCANGTKRWKCADCHARSKAHLASVKKSQ
jgi:hypothetical protein